MPIYEYQCTCCPSRFELKQSFDDSTLVSCPQCGGSTRRVFSPVPIIFKGSGFYSTDSRGDHSHSAPSRDGGEAKVDGVESRTGEAKVDGVESRTGEAKAGSTEGGTDEAKAGNAEKGK